MKIKIRFDKNCLARLSIHAAPNGVIKTKSTNFKTLREAALAAVKK